MPSNWKKIGDKPGDRGIYRNEVGTIRVVYQDARKGEKTRQKTETFPKGTYTITDPVTGASKRVTGIAKARDFKASVDLARKRGHKRDVAAEEMTLGEYWERWVSRPSKRTGKERRPTTAARIESAWRVHIAPTFAGRPIRSITVSDVLDWYAGLNGDRNKALRTLRSVLVGSVSEGLAPTNVAAAAEIRAQDQVRAVTREQVLTDEQMDALRNAVPERYRLMIDLLGVGLRIGEVCGLRRDRINLKGDIRIDNQLNEVGGSKLAEGPPKSANGYRTLHLNHLADELQRHIGMFAQPQTDGFVFTTETGHAPIRPSNWRERVFYPAVKAAGIPSIRPHDLRHVIVCKLADEGYSDTQIASWIGDDPRTVARTYRNVLVNTNARIGAFLGSRGAL